MSTAAVTPNIQANKIPFGGTQGAMGSPIASPVASAVPTATNPSATVQNNPYATVAPTTVAPGTVPSGVQSNGVNWTNGSNSIIGDFSDTYGKGSGEAITSVLQNMGTTTDSAIQATINNTNLAANQQYGNIQATEAAGGVTPNSSTAALAEGDFYSNVNSQLQQTIGGEEMGEENTLLSTLVNEGSAHGGDPSTWDSMLDWAGGAGGAASDVAELAAGL